MLVCDLVASHTILTLLLEHKADPDLQDDVSTHRSP